MRCNYLLILSMSILFNFTLGDESNLLSQFCMHLISQGENCAVGNALCDPDLTSIATSGNYTDICSTDSLFQLDLDRLRVNSARCRNEKSGNPNYFWLTLFVKNDSRNIVEWIVWHLLLGINFITVYDNESKDNIVKALEPLVKANLVGYIPWTGIGISAQQAAYRDAIKRAQIDNITWLGIVDVDEFILPIRDKCLPKMVSRFDNDKDTAAVVLNWRMMPGNYELSHRTAVYQSIFERTEYSLGYPNHHIKTILKPQLTQNLLTAHAASYISGYTAVSVDSGRPTNDSFNYPPEVTDAVILHYHVKSLEEWVAKKDRWRSGMNSKRCPACHQPLEGVIHDWLAMKKSEGVHYKKEFTRHTNHETDKKTVEFMKTQAAVMKEIITYS
jgi:Glycosyltransferase family 92